MRSYVYTFEPWEHQQLTWIHQTDLVKICVCSVRVSGLMVVCFPSRYSGISVVDAQDWNGSYLPSSLDLWDPSPVPRTQVWVSHLPAISSWHKDSYNSMIAHFPIFHDDTNMTPDWWCSSSLSLSSLGTTTVLRMTSWNSLFIVSVIC